MRFKVLNGITAEHVLQRAIFAVKMDSGLTHQKGSVLRKSLKVRARG